MDLGHPRFGHHLIALACLALLASAPAIAQDGGQRIEVTGSLIKRTDYETPSVVQSLTREDIKRSGYATLEELVRTIGASDAAGSIDDSKASGFVSGISTNSLRGFGAQATLTLINGRRVAPVPSVDINFGRGTLITVNALPKGAVERIDIVKDGASAIYGSDAMVGVVNYILRKDYRGAEVEASYMANDKGVGATKQANVTFGFGNLATQRFNVYGGIDLYQRDRVATGELLDKGQWDLLNVQRGLNNAQPRFSFDTVASNPGNYYRVPATFPAATTQGAIRTPGNSVSGPLFLGGMPGCPDGQTVGKGVPNRYDSFLASDPSFPNGMCRLQADNYAEWIGKQDRLGVAGRATFAISPSLTAYADVLYSRTKTTEDDLPVALTTALVTSSNPVATTWPKLDGTFRSQNAIILPVGHPDNPTNGTATAQPVQLLYRFTDLPNLTIADITSARLTAGVQGQLGAWDFDAALTLGRLEQTATRTNRLRSSLLTAAIQNASYRFGGRNDAAAIASVSSDAVVEGESRLDSLDIRAARDLFKLPGGMAALAMGVEARREKLDSVPSDIYLSGDFIGLVANGASGKRDVNAAYAELALPLLKQLELQAAVRHERYSDFGNTTNGKLGFKWGAVPSLLVLRGTVGTGFRAPAIAQISDSFVVSFHNSQDARIFDPIRCDSSNPAAPVSLAPAPVVRDCNVLNFSAVSGATPGNLPTVISGNPSLKPETSRSATLGLILSPTRDIDILLDAWYYERNDEIRVQRGIDIMRAYIANQAANAALLIRDPNPASWLPGVPNSGPILALVRQYGNALWTKGSGFDYDLTWRIAAGGHGRLTLKIDGSRTVRLDRQILAGGTIDRMVGNTMSDVPRNKFNITLRNDRGSWSHFVRLSHIDALERTGFTSTCYTSTNASNSLLRANSWCGVTAQSYVDLGTTYTGIKNLTVSASVLNVFDSYQGTQDVPAVHTYYYANTPTSLGRRFNVVVGYKF